MNRKWTEDDSRWLKANHGRMDLQTLSQELKVPLAEVERRLQALRLDVAPATPSQRPLAPRSKWKPRRTPAGRPTSQ